MQIHIYSISSLIVYRIGKSTCTPFKFITTGKIFKNLILTLIVAMILSTLMAIYLYLCACVNMLQRLATVAMLAYAFA